MGFAALRPGASVSLKCLRGRSTLGETLESCSLGLLSLGRSLLLRLAHPGRLHRTGSIAGTAPD